MMIRPQTVFSAGVFQFITLTALAISFSGFARGVSPATFSETEESLVQLHDELTQEGEEQDEKETPQSSKLKGKIIIPSKHSANISTKELSMALTQHFDMAEPELPSGWDEWKPEEQVAWWNSFQQSEEGKKFIAEQQERFKNRRVIEVVIGDNGDFDVFDVTSGLWDIRATAVKEVDGIEIIYETFGEIQVSENVEEIDLGEMEIMATPIYKSGDPIPRFVVEVNGKNLTPKSLEGKNVMLTFWQASNPVSMIFHQQVQQAARSNKVNLVAIGLEHDTEILATFDKENEPFGFRAEVKWDSDIVDLFGVRAIPWLAVIGPDGKFLMTDRELGYALRTSGYDLTEIIKRRLAGEEFPLPTPPETDAKEANKEDTTGNRQ